MYPFPGLRIVLPYAVFLLCGIKARVGVRLVVEETFRIDATPHHTVPLVLSVLFTDTSGNLLT